MKYAPVFTAVLVSVFLYFLVVDRDRLLEFAGVASGSESTEISMSAQTQDPNAPLIKVVVTRSEARVLDNAVPLVLASSSDVLLLTERPLWLCSLTQCPPVATRWLRFSTT